MVQLLYSRRSSTSSLRILRVAGHTNSGIVSKIEKISHNRVRVELGSEIARHPAGEQGDSMICMRFGSIFFTIAALAGCGSNSLGNTGTGGAQSNAGGVRSTGGASASGGIGALGGAMNSDGATSNAMSTGGTQGASTGANGGSGTGAGGSAPDANVIVKIGAGPAPKPQGGPITSGSYVLVAETIYGTLPPSMFKLGIGGPGDAVSAQITVTGDMYWQGFQAGGGSGGGQYGPLIPQALSISQLSAWDGSMPYTSTSSTLSLIMVHLYGDLGFTLGMYTVVDDYVLVSNGVTVGVAPPRLTGDAGTVVSQTRDPRCPTTVPDAGTACDPSAGPLECEYGGDSLGRCTQSTACALQTDGSYRFESYPSMGCDANPANCPASYGAANATSAIISDAGYCEPRDQFSCNYAEGLCSCGSVSSSLACACIAPGYASAYGSQLAPDGGNACPAQRPLSGDGCNTEDLWCLYGGLCGGLSLGPSMACIGGYWERLDISIPCPAHAWCP